MTDLDDLFRSLPLADIASRLGVSESDASVAVAAALPSLVKGLQANASDPAGAASLMSALGSKDASLASGSVDLDGIDAADGAKIVSHIFGGHTDAVATRLGGLGGDGVSSDLMKKVMAILAPIVLSWLVSKTLGGSTSGSTSGGIGDILGSVLGGALGGGSTPAPKSSSGGGLGDILGSVLGGSSGGGLDDLLGGLLGGGSR